MSKKITIQKIKKLKNNGSPFSCVTAYDFSTAKIMSDLDFPIILVGDSASMVMMGYNSTIPITISEMIVFVKSVVNGSKNSLIVADMPFMSYQSSVEISIKNAGRLLKEGGANAVKIEGGHAFSSRVEALVNSGIPVMGHIGLLPQSINQQSGYKVQGRSKNNAQKLLDDAFSIQEAGAFSVVLEGIPSNLAKKITKKLHIPTIGIGAGRHCDGQIQVFHDIVGLFNSFAPKHSKQYIDLSKHIKDSLISYISDVKNKKFPENKHSH